MRKYIAVAALLCALAALADDSWLATLVATTSSTGCGPLLQKDKTYSIQCSADTYVGTFSTGLDGGTNAAATNVKLATDKLYDITIKLDKPYVCIKGVSATTTCQLNNYRLKGE